MITSREQLLDLFRENAASLRKQIALLKGGSIATRTNGTIDTTEVITRSEAALAEYERLIASAE